MTDFQVPGPNTPSALTVDLGRPLFLVGRNGTGKSALVHRIQQEGGRRAIYLPGSRTSIFDGEGLSLTPSSRRALADNLVSWDNSPDTRWKNISGNQRNEKAVHDLNAAENQYKGDWANKIANSVDTSAAVAKLQSKVSPLDKVNLLLEQSNIPVRMLMERGELRASGGGNTFSFARMSDGERVALILIAEVIAAEPGAIFVIDEPELHLHRSIVVPLIAALINTRPDCEFIISTHELDLPGSVFASRVCIVRSVKWGSNGNVEHWDIDVVDQTQDLPEELVTDILGSRRRVLFTEGSDVSLDVPMYSVLFPKVSIRAKGGCKEVQRAVSGIRSTTSLHHTEGFGLIDNDGMSSQQITDYQKESIYALPFFSVESLYYDSDVVRAVAERQAATLAAKEDDQAALVATYLGDLTSGVTTAAGKAGTPEHLAGRVAERQVRDALIAQMPKRDDLIAASSVAFQLSGHSTFPAELSRFNGLLAAQDVHSIIARYPVRHSGILAAIAKALKFQSRANYEAAAIARISSDQALRDTLLAKLAPLAGVLNA